MNKVTSY